MTPGAEIREARVEDLDVPLFAPFGISGGSQDVARNLLVTVTLEDGTVGYGEAAPLPPFNGETQASARAALERACEAVRHLDATRWRRAARAAREAAPDSGAALCAIETAVLDALSRRAHLSLASFFGGVEDWLESDITIPLGDLEETRAAAQRAIEQGFRSLKIKVGGGDLDLDVARVAALARLDAVRYVIVDANAGLSVTAAVALVREVRRAGGDVALLEQPTCADDTAALGEVARLAEVAVAADESVTSASAIPALARAGVRVINVKLMKSGVAEALAIAASARAHGLDLMIGGMIETRLAMGMSACFAAGLGGFAFVDLDTPLFLSHDPFEGGYTQRGPILDVAPITAGHGARPRRAARPDLGKLH